MPSTSHGEIGRPCTTRIPALEEEIEGNPNISTPYPSSIFLKRYHPFHYTKVQALTREDFLRRVNFCNWFSNKLQVIPIILQKKKICGLRNQFPLEMVFFMSAII
ncbi:unnamed protein product, partial [Tenebrio molitor]